MKTLANANGYKYISDINAFYDESNGYYFYSESTQYVSLIRLVFTVEDTQDQQLKPRLDAICENYRAVSHEGVRLEDGKAIFEIRPQGFESPNELGVLISSLTDSMKRLHIKQSDEGVYEGLGLYRIGTHLSVKNESSPAVKSKDLEKMFKKQSASPLIAFVMAFVYMVPAILIYALVYNFGWMSSILCYAIMFQAFKGFDRYSMGASHLQISLILVMSLVGVLLGWYIAIGYQLYQSIGSLSITLTALAKISIIEALKANLMGLAIGMIFNASYIRSAYAGSSNTKYVNRKIKKLL